MECDDANIEMGRPGGDNMPFVYSGTLVVKGQGIAKVHSTGINTEIGKIGKTLQTVETEKTLLQRETGSLYAILPLLVPCSVSSLLFSIM